MILRTNLELLFWQNELKEKDIVYYLKKKSTYFESTLKLLEHKIITYNFAFQEFQSTVITYALKG